jgi:regulator of sigma E protease
MDIAVMVAQFFLSLSILVILHELGHFIPAKLFKTKVEKFYLFFDPWFSLFKFKKGDTEYGLGWLPLGGYVKIAGMIDESMDKEQMKQDPQPWEFRTKPAWQRLVIMLGGVTVNFLLGILIFSFMLWYYGEKYIPTAQLEYGIQTDSLGQALGLRNGDHILYLEDHAFYKFEPGLFKKDIIVNDLRQVKVLRDGYEMEVRLNEEVIPLLSSFEYKNYNLFGPRFPFTIGELVKGAPAEAAGFRVGDKMLGLNGIPTFHYSEFAEKLLSYPGQEVLVQIQRDGYELEIPVLTDESGRIGIRALDPLEIFGFEREEFPLLASIPAGAQKAVGFLSDQMKAFGKIFSGDIKAKDSLGGFASITNLFPTYWDWEIFWRITAILSLILGFMNLLPIPALDGGHVVFLLYEIISGRKPSDKFMEISTIVGFAVILTLLLYANGLDVMRFMGK